MREVHVGGSDDMDRWTPYKRSSRVVGARSDMVTLSPSLGRGQKAAVHNADELKYTTEWMELAAAAQCTAAGVGRVRTAVQARLEDWCEVEDGG